MIRFQVVFLTLASLSPSYSFSDDSTAEKDVPAVVLVSWQERWSESVTRVADSISNALMRDALPNADPESKALALSEVRSALQDHMSWERVGEDAVRQSLLRACGIDLLNEVEPYFSNRDLTSKMPEEIRKQYVSCWIDVDLTVNTSPAYAAMEFGKDHLPGILARHGIDSSRN